MGGVLVELEWLERVGGLLGKEIPHDKIHHFWVTSESVVNFESGKINFEDFCRDFKREHSLDVTEQTIANEFMQIIKGPFPGLMPVLESLKPKYHLALLSNTNPAHYNDMLSKYQFLQMLDTHFVSFKMGVMKPSPKIYEMVIEGLGIPAEQIAFFDDGKMNIEAASALGIHAYLTHSPQDIQKVVQAGF